MSGRENGLQLQKLTDSQVANRLGAYNADGGLERDLAFLWHGAGEAMEAAMRDGGGEEAAQQLRSRFNRPVDAEWIHAVAAY